MSLSSYLAFGALAGAAGTAAMDSVLYRRYRRAGGKDSFWNWEFASGVSNLGSSILPLLSVYQPIWKYDAKTLGDDLSAHLVFGTATSAVFAAFSRD